MYVLMRGDEVVDKVSAPKGTPISRITELLMRSNGIAGTWEVQRPTLAWIRDVSMDSFVDWEVRWI